MKNEKSAQHSNKQMHQQDHHGHSHSHSHIVNQNSGGHLHHSVVQNDLKLGLGMGGVGSNLGMMSGLDKTNQDLLKSVSKVNS